MGRGRTNDIVISELAHRTCDVVDAARLNAAGVSRDAIARRVQDGWMTPILPRVYAVGPSCHAPTLAMMAMAGVLAAGDGSAVGGATAAELLGVWDRGDGRVDVRGDRRVERSAPDRFAFHVDGLRPERQAVHGGVPLVGAIDMCRQFAEDHTKWQTAFLIDRCAYRGLVTIERLERSVLDAGDHRRGMGVLREAIALVQSGSVGSRGRTEDDVIAGLEAAGVREPVVNTLGALGLSRDEPDLVWPSLMKNVEIDGGHHDDPRQATDDDLRDAEAEALGWRVLRIHWRDCRRRPALVIACIVRFLDGERVPLWNGTRRLMVP